MKQTDYVRRLMNSRICIQKETIGTAYWWNRGRLKRVVRIHGTTVQSQFRIIPQTKTLQQNSYKLHNMLKESLRSNFISVDLNKDG